MKKTLMMIAGLALISTAAADSVGIRGGYYKTFDNDTTKKYVNLDGSGTFGIQYTYGLDSLSSIRGSIDLYPNMYGNVANKMGFGGEVAYLRKLPTVLSSNTNMNVYVGGGLGVNYVDYSVANKTTANTTQYRITGINPTVMAGVNYYATPQLGIFGELAGGVSFLNGTISNSLNTTTTNFNATTGFIHPRIGLTYTIR